MAQHHIREIGEPAARVPDESGSAELRHLKMSAAVLPLAFIVVIDLAFLATAGGQLLPEGARTPVLAMLIAVSVASVATFGGVMFHCIDRARADIVRQNRQLAALNAVSSAVQGAESLDALTSGAKACVKAVSGALDVTFALPARDDPQVCPEPRVGADSPAHILDIPLAAGSASVGWMRLYLPGLHDDNDPLSQATLQSIGHELGEAIHATQLLVDLRRGKREGHALQDVLVQISNHTAPPDVLAAVVHHARNQLGGDEAALSINEGESLTIHIDGLRRGESPFAVRAACITSEHNGFHDVHKDRFVCPVRSSPQWRTTLTVPVAHRGRAIGDLWIARRADTPFTERDRRFLTTLAGLAAMALSSARTREDQRQAAIVDERQRIAREMHDGLAQILGATHLRLRALETRPDVRGNPFVSSELAQLAETCADGYRDVREAILGLRESGRVDRGLLDGLRAYLAKYTRDCGISTWLESNLVLDPALSPACEVQIIRVIQEALTNARKHSGASAAVVRVRETATSTIFEVDDDGHGFDSHAGSHIRERFGLSTMAERMELIGGTLNVDSVPGRGTRVIAEVPETSRPRLLAVEGDDGGKRGIDTHLAR